MKRFTFFASIFLISVFALSACGPTEEAEETPGLDLTPGLEQTPLETEAETEPPLSVTETPVAEETETLVTAATETPAAEVTETPAQETPEPLPPTGTGQDQPWKLSHLLDFQLLDQNCDPTGEVESVVFDVSSGEIFYLMANSTITVTPEITETPALTETATVTETAEANLVLVPWRATDLFNPQAAGEEVGTTETGTPTTHATPSVTETPAAATATVQATPTVSGAITTGAGERLCPEEEQAVALTVAQDVFVSAPAFAEAPDMTAADWDADITAYWSDQIETALTPVSNPGVIDSITGLTLHGQGGENFGPVVEIILDTATGNFTHIVFSPGGILNFNDRVIPVPWEALDFEIDTGQFILAATVDRADLEQAPNFNSVEALPDPEENPDWDQDIEAFWSDIIS